PPASPRFVVSGDSIGRVGSGSFRGGDYVVELPSRARTTVTGIVTHDGLVQEACARQSITLGLADDLDVGGGDLISCEAEQPQVRTEFKATLCWISDDKLHLNHGLTRRHTTKTVRAIIREIDHRLNVNTLERESPVSELQTNDIAQVRLKTLQPVVCDPYSV